MPHLGGSFWNTMPNLGETIWNRLMHLAGTLQIFCLSRQKSPQELLSGCIWLRPMWCHTVTLPNNIFKASALWEDAFYKSNCRYVCVFVCSLLRNSLTVFLPPLPKSRMSQFFRDWESLGKSNGKKWSHIWKLLLIKGVKLPRIFFLRQIQA